VLRSRRNFIRTGQAAAILVVAIAVLAWSGWASRLFVLTRILPDWPQTVPWTALWLAGLGTAILVQSGRPSTARIATARGIGAAVGIAAAVVVAEYLTRHQSGSFDQIWFAETVREMPSQWPGRPSIQTAVSILLMALGVVLAPARRRTARGLRLAFVTMSVVVPWTAVVAYVFAAIAIVQTGPNTGMGMGTAVGILLLATATAATQPDEYPFAWALSARDPGIPIRLLILVGSFPIIVGITQRVLTAINIAPGAEPVFSTLVGAVAVGAAVLYLSQREEKLLAAAEADRALLRAINDSAKVGMCLLNNEGGFVQVNDAACRFFGYDAETLTRKTWQELTPDEYLQPDLRYIADIQAGRIDTYRMEKQYVHADGHLIWGYLSVGCVRGANGRVKILIAQIVDIDDEVKSRELLAESARENRLLAEHLQADLDEAAAYVKSVLPSSLAGPVRACSSYQPARTVGGDCFDYFWLTDDLLVVHLLDVAGHGVGPALVAASVQNMLRANLAHEGTAAQPGDVLAELNRHFCTNPSDGSFFTIWFGVFRVSTATLHYAGGGHPPAILLNGGRPTLLPSQAAPVGVFADSAFSASVLPIEPDSELLLYSDGVFERSLPDGRMWSFQEFLELCSRMSASGDWTCEDFIDSLPRTPGTGELDDDCTFLKIKFART